jgi:hypothetical protein
LSGDRFFSLSSAKWRRGLGLRLGAYGSERRGGAFLLGIPLSSILSPLPAVPGRGEEEAKLSFETVSGAPWPGRPEKFRVYQPQELD